MSRTPTQTTTTASVTATVTGAVFDEQAAAADSSAAASEDHGIPQPSSVDADGTASNPMATATHGAAVDIPTNTSVAAHVNQQDEAFANALDEVDAMADLLDETVSLSGEVLNAGLGDIHEASGLGATDMTNVRSAALQALDDMLDTVLEAVGTFRQAAHRALTAQVVAGMNGHDTNPVHVRGRPPPYHGNGGVNNIGSTNVDGIGGDDAEEENNGGSA